MLRISLAILGVFLLGTSARADDGGTGSAIVGAEDKAAIDANMDKDATVEGVVAKASWSRSGKVMSITFKGTEESHFTAVLFEKSKDRFDKAFGGDTAKNLTGAKVRVKGKLSVYAGKGDAQSSQPQIVLSMPDQITVIEIAATQPSTEKSE